MHLTYDIAEGLPLLHLITLALMKFLNRVEKLNSFINSLHVGIRFGWPPVALLLAQPGANGGLGPFWSGAH